MLLDFIPCCLFFHSRTVVLSSYQLGYLTNDKWCNRYKNKMNIIWLQILINYVDSSMGIWREWVMLSPLCCCNSWMSTTKAERDKCFWGWVTTLDQCVRLRWVIWRSNKTFWKLRNILCIFFFFSFTVKFSFVLLNLSHLLAQDRTFVVQYSIDHLYQILRRDV